MLNVIVFPIVLNVMLGSVNSYDLFDRAKVLFYRRGTTAL